MKPLALNIGTEAVKRSRFFDDVFNGNSIVTDGPKKRFEKRSMMDGVDSDETDLRVFGEELGQRATKI
jgi:hypothetical protein